jgi:hypothetical protein
MLLFSTTTICYFRMSNKIGSGGSTLNVTHAIPSSIAAMELLTKIQAERSPELRYEAYGRLALYAEEVQDYADSIHECLWTALKEDTAAWGTHGLTIQGVEESFSTLKKHAEEAKARREYRLEAVQGLRGIRPDSQDWTIVVPLDHPSQSLLRAAARHGRALFSRSLTPADMLEMLNQVVVERLRARRHGGARVVGPTTVDYTVAGNKSDLDYASLVPIPDSDLAAFGLRRNAHGLAEALPATGPQALRAFARAAGGLASSLKAPIEAAWSARSANQAAPRSSSPGGTPQKPCGCGQEVTARYKLLIDRRERRQLPLMRERLRQKLVREFSQLVEAGVTICPTHTKAAATAVGLRSRFRTDVLRHRLMEYSRHCTTIGDVKTWLDTYAWFALTVRPKHPAEIRGVYKYDPLHADVPSRFKPAVLSILKDFEERYGGEIGPKWEAEGSVTAPIFDWWFRHQWPDQPVIWDMVREEFEMYNWHYRKDHGHSGSLGWLRAMYHSGAQQLMRMDPEYYRLYVALRPDHQWRLISYPYYAKFAHRGDNTFFRHIDINIKRYLEDGRGGNMIQGSLSLDDESQDMCTELVPGMHRAGLSRQWYERVKARGTIRATRPLGAAVNRIEANHWTYNDALHFGADFEPRPCKRGEVRITSPLLPHGSTAMPERDCVRRTMLPWFVGIQSNHADMEVVEMGSWAEIALAHISLEAAPASPSGKPNAYGGIPYRFPASLPLGITSPLSLALVGRTRWDMPDVVKERNLILGDDSEAYVNWLQKWRSAAAVAYKTHHDAAAALEQEIYGHKSFYACRGDPSLAPAADTEMTDEIRAEIEADTRRRGVAKGGTRKGGQASPANHERVADTDGTTVGGLQVS